MKQVRLRTILAGPNGVAQPGAVISVSDEEAKQLVNGRYASYVELEVKEEPKEEVTEKETTSEDRSEVEKAVEPEPRKKKRGRPPKKGS